MSKTNSSDLDGELIDEIITRYVLEPTLKDVFVEGDEDARVMTAFLTTCGLLDVHTHPIDAVEVPHDLCAAAGLPVPSNRSRVIVLARELERQLSPRPRWVACIVDSDLDTVLRELTPTGFLCRTDYSSIEAYGYNESVILRFVQLYASRCPLQPHQLDHTICETLRWLFSLRLARHTTRTNIAFPAIQLSCRITSGEAVFDRLDFMTRWLGHLPAARSAVESAAAAHQAVFSEDHRFYMHGHDLIDLLVGWVGPSVRESTARSRRQFSRVFLTLFDLDKLRNEPLFAAMLQHFQ